MSYYDPCLRLLVIDDDEESREKTGDILRNMGHTVFELTSPVGALQAIWGHMIDVVVADVRMIPAIRSDRSIRLLFPNENRLEYRIVLISDGPFNELRRIGKELGAHAVLRKKDLENGLARTVAMLVQSRAA